MPAKLPEGIRSIVIQQWLQGRSRNEIAAENGISSGAVTNIVNEWRRNLGFDIADELRQLVVTIKQVGITASQCALGFRVAMIMIRMGVNENSIEEFVTGVYNRCKDIGLSPENISNYIRDLVEFATTNVLPISKVPDYLKGKTDEKRNLEEEIQRLNAEIATLRQEKKDCEFARDQALQERDMTIAQLKWYSELKEELRKYSISVDDVSEFARLVNNLRQHSGYEVDKVINEFWNLEALRTNHKELQKTIGSLKNSVDKLQQERSTLEVYVAMHRQTISTYEQLKNMGFGINELNFLFDTINEIAVENDIPVRKAVNKFLSDVEEQYNKKIGFDAKLHKMRDEFNNLRNEQANLRTEMMLNPLIASKLSKLTLRGLDDQDIINIADLIEKYAASSNASASSNSGHHGGSKDIQSLISELDKYNGLKSAIEHLTQQASILRKDTDFLSNQKQDLERNNQRIFSDYIQLNRTVDFLQGVAFSLTNEITNLAAIYSFTMSLLKLQFGYIKKEQSAHQFNGFEALSRSSRGEEVPINEIKEDVAKAIKVLLDKTDPNDDTLAGNLLIAYEALKE